MKIEDGSHTYTFEDQKVMSEGVAVTADVQSILLPRIPGAIEIRKATESEDRHGTDWWVNLENKDSLSVDLKAREHDYAAKKPPRDDLALETWSVLDRICEGGIRVEHNTAIGWTRDQGKRTDYVLWIWKPMGDNS